MTRLPRVGALCGALILLACRTEASIPLAFGTTYSGNIALPGESHTYTFTGTPGSRLFLDSLEGDNLQMNLTLTSPTGALLYQRNDDYDFGPFVLNESGTYSLVVNGIGSTTGNYQFRLLDLSAAPSLTLGTTVSGELNPPLACNIYQFNGKRGQRINLQNISFSSNAAQWQLVTPANVALASGYIYQNLGVVTLPVDGPYCLMVSGFTLGIPAVEPFLFQVLLTDVSDNPVATSGFGSANSGTVNANQTNSFTYTASAGLPVYFDSLDTSGQSLVVDLIDPTGTAVFTVSEIYDAGPYVLPRSGTYTLNVRGPGGSSGNFSFRLLDLTASPPLPLNSVVSNSLAAPFQTDVYQLSAGAGQRLYYDGSGSLASVQARLLGPDGQTPILGSAIYDLGPTTLSYSGTYYFFVQSSLATSASYQFEWFDIAAQPPLPINTGLTGNLAANASSVYQLSGTNGETLFFNGESVSAGGATWTLYDPKNAYVPGGSGGLSSDFAVTLAYHGTYVLVIANGANSLSFSNQVSTFGYQTNALAFGTPITNNISYPGNQVIYTFTGTAGHRLYFDSLLPTYLSITFNLFSPSGVATAYGNASNDGVPFTLPETGTYQLIFSASGDTTGPLSFQLLEVDAQPPLPLNADFTGSLPTFASGIYQLAGTNGEQLYFHGKGAFTGGAFWTLYDTRNIQIGNANISGDFSPPVVLPYSGNYTVVFSAGANPVNYSNQVNTFTIATNALTLGTPVTNNIFNPGDQVFYTFTGTAGQRLYFDSLFPAYAPMYVTLVSPTGLTVLYGNPSYDLSPITLPETGTYTLQFSASGNFTGGLNFQLIDIGAQPALPLNTDLNATLPPNVSTIYQIAGTAGEQLYFNAKGVSASGANWTLFGPNNVSSGWNAYLGGDFEVTLPYTGNYALVFAGGPNTVTYTNQVNTFAYTTNALPLGSLLNGSLVNAGDQLYYTFTGTAGQRIYFDSRLTNNINAYLNLISPGGVSTYLGNPYYDRGPLTLTQSGTYSLVFDGVADTTGPIAFDLLDLAAAAPITLGTTVTDSLSDQTQTRFYRFSGTAGQRVNLQSFTSSTTLAIWSLYGLSDQGLGSSGQYISANIGIVTLPATGTYVIGVSGNGLNTTPVNYQFSVTDVSDTPVSVTGLGVVNSGTIGANQTNTFTFSAPAGLPIFFDSQDTSGQNLLVALISPDGTSVFTVGETADSVPYVLPRSGTYTLQIWAPNGASGNYSFRLLDLSASTVLPLNTPVTGTLSNAYQTDVYQFNSTAGQRLLYNGLTNDINNPSVFVQLLDPRAQTVGVNGDFANSTTVPFTIQYAGTCYLLLRNNKTGANGFNFQLLDTSAQAPLPLNGAQTNTLGAYAMGVYRFSGTAGQQLYFRGSSGNPYGSWYLFDPNNAIVSDAGLAGDFVVALPISGTYVVTFVNSSGNPGTEVFEVSDFTYFTNAYTIGSSVADAINRPGEQRYYTFTGTVGQRLYYDALTNAPASPNNIVATLLNPQGNPEGPLSGGFFNDRGPFTLQQSGTYKVVFAGLSSSTGAFAFRLLDIAAQATLPLNTAVTNPIDVFPAILYRYSGTAGQQLYFHGQPNNLSGYWTLYDPNNSPVPGSGANLFGDFEVTLPMNGTYALVLYNNTTAPGPESFQVNDFAYFTNAYTIGATVVDSINRPGERRLYTFNGTIGQQLYYDALTNNLVSPNAINVILLNPQGNPEALPGGGFGTDRGPFALQQTGLYTLIMDGYQASVGAFAFRLLDINSQPDLPLNAPVTNSLGFYPAIVYKYSGTPGQQLYFRGQSSNPNGSWTLYDPNNALVGYGYASLISDFEVTLPLAGTYALVLINYGPNPGTEVFAVNPFDFGESLQINQAPVLTLIPAQITGESAPLLFTAQATDPDGDALTFSLDPGGPPGATINPATGGFSWTPPPTGFSFSTNVTVRVTDNGTPQLSAAQTVTISVISGPVMIGVQKTAASATVFWRSAPGKHYQLYYKNSLQDATWTPIGTVLAATDYISSEIDATVGANETRYYRVQLLDPTP